jgi:hypothetical protein
MKKFFVLTSVVFLMAGCVTAPKYTWKHPEGRTQAQIQTDLEMCEAKANGEIRRDITGLPATGETYRGLMIQKHCMMEKGYRNVKISE